MDTTNPSAMSDPDPRPAATLVVLRDSPRGLEVLLTKRPKTMRFMGGATVFPGGGVGPEDRDERWGELSTLTPAAASAALDEPNESLALGYYVAALREAFEEVGFTWSPSEPPGDGVREGWLARHLTSNTRLETDRLVRAGRWVTPHGSALRFDTRFFVTPAPEGWEPVADPSEVDEVMWATPGRALEELATGTALMAPPTAAMLQKLERFSDAAEALRSIGGQQLYAGESIYRVRLSPLVQVVLAPNPGVMTGPGTNTYVVGTGPTMIIDPAVGDQEYVECLLEAAGDVSTILITHRHSDHVGGVPVVANHTGAPVRAWGDELAGGTEVLPLVEGEVIESGEAELRVVFAPGHASDHACFWLPHENSLFAGDNVLGEGTSVIAPPDGDMKAYLDSLRRLEQLQPQRIYPGHFRPLDDGTQVIRGYIEHRLERERKIVKALEPGPATLEEVVTTAYDDTPVELHPAAQMSALAHLEALEKDGRVNRLSQRWELSGVE